MFVNFYTTMQQFKTMKLLMPAPISVSAKCYNLRFMSYSGHIFLVFTHVGSKRFAKMIGREC